MTSEILASNLSHALGFYAVCAVRDRENVAMKNHDAGAIGIAARNLRVILREEPQLRQFAAKMIRAGICNAKKCNL